MLESKEALKRIIEICLVKPPEDFSSLCGILVSILGLGRLSSCTEGPVIPQ